MPRVTEVLSYFPHPKLIEWKVKLGKRESGLIGRKAMSVGTNVDQYIRAKIDGQKPPKLKTLEAENCVKAYEMWYDLYKPELKTGKRIYYKAYGDREGSKDSFKFALNGEPDLYWGDTVIDLKCSGRISDSYWLQTAVYCKLAGKQNRAILRLDKNMADYEYVKREGFEEDYQVYLGLLQAYYYFNPEKREEDEHADYATDCKE